MYTLYFGSWMTLVEPFTFHGSVFRGSTFTFHGNIFHACQFQFFLLFACLTPWNWEAYFFDIFLLAEILNCIQTSSAICLRALLHDFFYLLWSQVSRNTLKSFRWILQVSSPLHPFLSSNSLSAITSASFASLLRHKLKRHLRSSDSLPYCSSNRLWSLKGPTARRENDFCSQPERFGRKIFSF